MGERTDDYPSLLARAQSATGNPAEAVRTLEKALHAPDTAARKIPQLEDQFVNYAWAALPDLPTYDCIELALASLHQPMLVSRGATWRFFRGTKAPSAGIEWTQLDFSAEDWETGASGFGYGDRDDTTVLDDMAGGYLSLYIRHHFEVLEAADYQNLVLSVMADDGFVAYLNGRELTRVRVGAEAVLPHDAQAEEASEPLVPAEFSFTPKWLRVGTNVLAIQGLNRSLSSSDFSLIPTLRAELKPKATQAERVLADYRSVARGPGADARVAYLEGRLLQQKNQHREAAKRFFTAAASDPQSPEPVLALAKSLRASGEPDEAERHLRQLLETECPQNKDLWNAWLAVCWNDLGRTADQILEKLPSNSRNDSATARSVAESTTPESRHYTEDLRWLLEKLQNGQPIRINCGGDEYKNAEGSIWHGDCFYNGGSLHGARGRRVFEDEINGTDDAPLYQTERYFFPSALTPAGYSIPLTRGAYQITLHFAEITYHDPETRLFDVRLEDDRVLERFDPGGVGYATAQARSFEITVEDGLLNIEFVPQKDYPKISAIAIESHVDQ